MKLILKDKSGRSKVNSGMIVGVIVAVIFAMVLFSILPTVYPDMIQDYYNFTSELELLSTELGTGPSTFAGNMHEYAGWFWVLGPFLLVIGIALTLFKGGRGRR